MSESTHAENNFVVVVVVVVVVTFWVMTRQNIVGNIRRFGI